MAGHGLRAEQPTHANESWQAAAPTEQQAHRINAAPKMMTSKVASNTSCEAGSGEPSHAWPECGPARARSTASPQYLILHRRRTAAPWRSAASPPSSPRSWRQAPAKQAAAIINSPACSAARSENPEQLSSPACSCLPGWWRSAPGCSLHRAKTQRISEAARRRQEARTHSGCRWRVTASASKCRCPHPATRASATAPTTGCTASARRPQRRWQPGLASPRSAR